MSKRDAQLSREIQQADIPYLAGCFDSVDPYPDLLKLTGGEKTDVMKTESVSGTQVAMIKCLSLWKSHNPWSATYKALLGIMLRLGKIEEASKVLKQIQ